MPAGGVFSGIGIDGNEFDPLKSGIGSFHRIYFTSSNGCETVAKQTINVVDLVELDITLTPCRKFAKMVLLYICLIL